MSSLPAPGILSYLEALLDMDQILPGCYKAYRQAVRDTLIFFLTSLSRERQASLFHEQMAMPGNAGTFERFVALLSRCPTLHKLGQIMARNRDLDPDLRLRLQALESLHPSTTLQELLPVIQKELKGRGDIVLEEKPLAEASVAVVVPFSENGKEGVLKVLKPGILSSLTEELEIWSHVGSYLEERCENYRIPPIDYKETLQSLQGILEREVQLEIEQDHMRQMAEFYAGAPGIIIPSVYEWSTPSMTAMGRVRGGSVAALKDPVKGIRTAALVIEEVLARPFWSSRETVLFHGDPHGGNMLLTDEGRVALLDWSLVIPMGKGLRSQLMEILLNAFMAHRHRICRNLCALSRRPPDRARLKEVVEESLSRVRKGAFPGFDWMIALFDQAMLRAGLSLHDDMVLFRKALLTLINLVCDISQEASADIIMTASGLSHLFSELPERVLDPAGTETYRSHLRNVDMIEALSTLPLSAGRMWLGSLKESLKAPQGEREESEDEG